MDPDSGPEKFCFKMKEISANVKRSRKTENFVGFGTMQNKNLNFPTIQQVQCSSVKTERFVLILALIECAGKFKFLFCMEPKPTKFQFFSISQL